jgi:uncharacterized protein
MKRRDFITLIGGTAARGTRAAGRAGARSSGPGGARFAEARLRSSSLLLRKPVVDFNLRFVHSGLRVG